MTPEDIKKLSDSELDEEIDKIRTANKKAIKNKNKKNLHTKYIAYKKHTPNVVMLLPHPRKRTRYIIVRKIYIMRTMYML